MNVLFSWEELLTVLTTVNYKDGKMSRFKSAFWAIEILNS